MSATPAKIASVIEKASDGLTATEVARRLGVDPQTVRNWIHSGKLPAVSFGPDGTLVRVDPAELDQLRQPVVPKK
jgi:excisionase family DNA binding protein